MIKKFEEMSFARKLSVCLLVILAFSGITGGRLIGPLIVIGIAYLIIATSGQNTDSAEYHPPSVSTTHVETDDDLIRRQQEEDDAYHLQQEEDERIAEVNRQQDEISIRG